MKTALDPRHIRRQKIVQELFAWEAQHKIKNQKSKIKNSRVGDEKTKEIIDNVGEIDKLIRECAPEWEIEKINEVDLAILRLAIFELAFEDTEPAKVIIDEAVELAKEFGGEASPAFVNGALGKALVSQERILRIIADRFGIEKERLVPQANLKTDLNVTDLEVADLLTALEKDLMMEIPHKDNFVTIGDLLAFIEDHGI